MYTLHIYKTLNIAHIVDLVDNEIIADDITDFECNIYIFLTH